MPRISLFRFNLVLWAVIVLLLVVYAEPLRWAQDDFPDYLRGKIGRPEERSMYRDARRIIRDGGDLDRARELLEGSLAIDPTCEAGYWLARYHVEVGDDEAALAQFERYLEIDPMMPEAWAGAVEAAERLGRIDDAIRIASSGAEYFDDLARVSAPVPIRGVGEKFNDKARKVYNKYRDATVQLRLRAEYHRLKIDGDGDGDGDVAAP